MNAPETPTSEPAVDIADLRFGYRSNPDVIDIKELRVATTERVFLFGPSGCGKSTLLALIGGVLVPRDGRLAVLGTELSAAKNTARDRFRADHIGFVFQQFNLVPYLSVDENVCLPCRYSPRRLERSREDDGSAEKSAARLLNALGISGTLRARKPTDLSVGQQQRVALARALIGRPELIIADEPTSALDANRRREFIDLLLSECDRSKSAVIFVSPRYIPLQTASTVASICKPQTPRNKLSMLRNLRNTLALVVRSVLNRRTTALLTVASIAVSVALLSAVDRVRTDAQTSFENTIAGTDLIIGARSGELNLLLYSVFRIGNPTNNIRWTSFRSDRYPSRSRMGDTDVIGRCTSRLPRVGYQRCLLRTLSICRSTTARTDGR